MHVVGGVYRERCTFPPDDVIFGSGGRSAAALSALCPDITLSTFVADSQRDRIEYQADRFWNVQLKAVTSEHLLTFDYYHGLSTPSVHPTPTRTVAENTVEVSEDTILVFGMLEGHSKVHGRRVVYDPQNPRSPHRFGAWGSTADELAYVLNVQELRKLTDLEGVDEAALALLNEEGVKLVLVKLGALGARLYTDTSCEHVPAHSAKRVWPIGSGDVFAAAFAYYWGECQRNPKEAAMCASRAAATYCNTRQLPLQRKDVEHPSSQLAELQPQREPGESKVYLAGPFFTMGQLWLVDEIRRVLRGSAYGVFSPYHEVGMGDANEVAWPDIWGIEGCDAMFAVCDGIDAGTFFEIGYATKAGIPVVALAEQTGEEALKMVAGTGCKVYRDLPTAIYQVQWAALTHQR